MKLLILIAIYTVSEEVLKNFETIYLTVNESMTLKLHDYYSYKEIDFSILNTNMTENDIKLKHDTSLTLISHIPGKTVNYSLHSPKASKTFPFITFPDGAFFARFIKNEVYGYFWNKNTELLQEIWKIQIKQNTIFQIAIFQLNSGIYNMILGTKITPEENEIYTISLEDFRKPGIPLKLDLWDIKYLEDLKISTENSKKIVLAIFGRFKSGKQVVFIYRNMSPQSIYLAYSFNNYIDSGEYENADLNIVEIILSHYQLLLLDSKLGLFIYEFLPYNFGLWYKNFIDLRKYGRIYSMDQTNNYHNNLPLAVSTDAGVVLIYSRYSYSEFNWINTYDAFGFLTPANYAIVQLNWIFSQVEINSSYYLMVYETAELQNRESYQNIANFNLKSIIGDNFDPYGEWMILRNKNKTFYIRNDFDGVKIFLLEAEDWSIEILGSHSFYVEIVGKSNHKAKKGVKKSINVISLPAGSYEICHKPSGMSLALNEYYMDYEYYNTIKLNSIFFGPNLTYSIDSFSFPDNFSSNISIAQREHLINEILLPKNAEIIKLDSEIIAYSIKNKIFVYSLNTMIIVTVLSNFSNIYEFFMFDNPDRIVIFETENLANKISLCQIYQNDNETHFCNEINSNINCIFTLYLKAVVSYILCANHETIYIYSVDYEINEIIFINKEILNLPEELYIIDLEWLWYNDFYPFKVYLYINCNYGVILVELELPDWSINFKTINKFPKKIKIIRASFDYIVITFSDNTIGIYDILLQHIKTLGPHFDGNIENIYATVNLIYLQFNNKIAIYEWHEAVHESLQQIFEIKDSCKLKYTEFEKLQFRTIHLICKFSDKSVIQTHKFGCEIYDERYRCYPKVLINLKINQDLYIENKEQKGWISISAKNQYYHLKSKIEFNLHINYDPIWIDNRKLPKKLEISYNKEKIIDLSQVFHGNNAQTSMIVNNITYEYNENNYFPARFWQNFNEIYAMQLPTSDAYSDQVFVANKLILTSMNGFIILDTSRNIPKIDAMLSYEIYINSRSIKCRKIDAIHSNENVILIFSICAYIPYYTRFWNGKFITLNHEWIYSILIIEYDFIKKISLKTQIIDNIPNFLDLKAVKLNNYRFEVILYEKIQSLQTIFNNYILRYKGTIDDKAISIMKHERIDFFSLEINQFSILSIDIVLSKFGQLYLYIIEYFYGLIIIQVHDIFPAKIVGGLKHPDSRNFASLYHCQNNLYIITNKNELYEYSINEALDLKLVKSFYWSSSWANAHKLNNKLLSYQEDCKYIIFATLDVQDTYIILHIWNDDEYFNFSISNYYHNAEFRGKFLKNNVIAYVDTLESKLKIYSLNSRYIEIPALSKANYKNIVKKWGTDEFQLELCLYNENEKYRSEKITLKRSNNHLNSSTQWWAWFLISFSIILLAIISVWILIQLKIRNKRLKIRIKDEGVMMEEIKNI